MLRRTVLGLQGTGVDIEAEDALLDQHRPTAPSQQQRAQEEPCLSTGPLMAKVRSTYL